MAYIDLQHPEISWHRPPRLRPEINIREIRSEFPILERNVRGKPLIYLDNAATSQKPRRVIETIDRYYRQFNANVHRGVHYLSEQSTVEYEQARKKVQRFINAREDREIVFVKGATEAINLVARSFGARRLGHGDEIMLSEMEHHSNIVPWQMIAQETGASIRVIPITDKGELRLDELNKLIGSRTKMIAVSHVSNALGTINPIREIVQIARRHGVPVLVDGAQAVSHLAIDVRDLDCDFYALSGHKAFGPTGIGVLYGKAALLENMLPYQGGGDMISRVSFERSTYQEIPYKFEAGTPNIAGAIGFGSAIDFMTGIGMDAISAYENQLLRYAEAAVSQVPGLEIVGTATQKAAIISFTLEGIHPHDIATILDQQGIAVRAGHHCAMPVMERYGLAATTRASFACYNTTVEIDQLVHGLIKARQVFTC